VLLPASKIQPLGQPLKAGTLVTLTLVLSPDNSAHYTAILSDDLPAPSALARDAAVTLECGLDCASLDLFTRQLTSAQAIYVLPASPS
jgi:hypothetical protein